MAQAFVDTAAGALKMQSFIEERVHHRVALSQDSQRHLARADAVFDDKSLFLVCYRSHHGHRQHYPRAIAHLSYTPNGVN